MTQAVKDRPSVWRKPPEMPELGRQVLYQFAEVDFDEPEFEIDQLDCPLDAAIGLDGIKRWAYVSDLLEC